MEDVLTGPWPLMLMSLVSVMLAWVTMHRRHGTRPALASDRNVERTRRLVIAMPALADIAMMPRRQGLERWIFRMQRRTPASAEARAVGDVVAGADGPSC